MQERVQQFVERMGLQMEADGMPRIAGRLVGFLMVHQGPFSLDELAERLQVSKASVSTNARLLEQHGMLERTSEPGDRRDYYQLSPDPWSRALEVAAQKWETFRMLFTEAAAALPEEMQEARRNLIQAEQFHLLLMDEAERVRARWRQRQAEAADAVAAER